jgi:hypothetical protein
VRDNGLVKKAKLFSMRVQLFCLTAITVAILAIIFGGLIWRGKGGELVTDEDDQQWTWLRPKLDKYFSDPNYLAKWSRDQLFLIFLFQWIHSGHFKPKKMGWEEMYDVWAEIIYEHIYFMLSSVQGRKDLKPRISEVASV